MTDINYVYGKYFPKSFCSYDRIKRFVMAGRWPTTVGRQYTQSFRIIAVEGDDGMEFHAYVGDHKIVVYHPDNTVTFVASTKTVWHNGHTLSGNIQKLVPVFFRRLATGRYNVVAPSEVMRSLTDDGRNPMRSRWHRAALTEMHKQEYFESLRLDLTTGKIINPRDLNVVVDEEKRKQWTAGLKQTRLKLRAMVRVGVFDNRKLENHSHYMSSDKVRHLANCIMAGGLDADAQEHLVSALSSWKMRRFKSVGDAVLHTFESAIKTHSREMRVMVGVLDSTP